MVVFGCILFSSLFGSISCCDSYQVIGNPLRNKVFSLIPFSSLSASPSLSLEVGGGRPSYISVSSGNRDLYLYHILTNFSGNVNGRWVINDQFGSLTQAIAYIDSWAILPHLAPSAENDSRPQQWTVFTNQWIKSSDFSLQCTYTSKSRLDSTVYVETTSIGWSLSGYYMKRNESIFSQIGLHLERQVYLYKYSNQWIIGENPGSDVALAYVLDTADTPSSISNLSTWSIFHPENQRWENSVVHILDCPQSAFGKSFYDCTKNFRSLKSRVAPNDISSYRSLSNGLIIPSIGLGTGGISAQLVPSVFHTSFSLGYRLYDLAREYRNEHVFGRILAEDDVIPSLKGERSGLFLVSKVWPTYLGYSPTLDQISLSLNELKTAYIDMYFLHWPE